MRTKGDALEGDALDGLCERGSGGFRKTMRSSDWEWVRPLMDLVKHTGSDNLHGFEKLLDADAEVEVDEEGWPTISKTSMASCEDGKEEEDDAEDREGADEEGADNMSVGKSVVSMSRNSSCRTLLYDDEGFPHCFWPPHAEPCSTTTLEEQQAPANDDDVVGDDDLKPIVPRARARKAQAKAVKKKPAAKPVVPAHVPLVLGCSKCRYVPTGCGQCKNPSFGRCSANRCSHMCWDSCSCSCSSSRTSSRGNSNSWMHCKRRSMLLCCGCSGSRRGCSLKRVRRLQRVLRVQRIQKRTRD